MRRILLAAFLLFFRHADAGEADLPNDSVFSAKDTARLAYLISFNVGIIPINTPEDYDIMDYHILGRAYHSLAKLLCRHGNPEAIDLIMENVLPLYKKQEIMRNNAYLPPLDQFAWRLGYIVDEQRVEALGGVFKNPIDPESLKVSSAYYFRLVDRGIPISDEFRNEMLRVVDPRKEQMLDIYKAALGKIGASPHFEKCKNDIEEANSELFGDILNKKEFIDSASFALLRNFSYRNKQKDGKRYDELILESSSPSRANCEKIIELPEMAKNAVLKNNQCFQDIPALGGADIDVLR